MDEQKKRMDELTPQEKKRYDKLAKRKQRAKDLVKAEEARLEALVPEAFSYKMAAYRIAQLEIILADTIIAIAAQHQLSGLDEECIDRLVRGTFGFENKIFKEVQCQGGYGVFCGGVFPDFVAANSVEHCHKYPEMLRESPTFAGLYRDFLELTAAWFKTPAGLKHGDPGFRRTVELALQGKYVLPVKPPKMISEVIPEKEQPAVPGYPEILYRQGVQTMNQIEAQERGLSEAARRYLNGGKP